MTVSLSEKLLSWYAAHRRKLPWRENPDPYAVWISEIMLQQTRVETVLPYYRRWMARFPDLEALASASQQEILSMWEGLGYYSRARNLHHAARRVFNEHAGRLPEDPAELQRLPGIGRYTAAAIASIAFGRDVVALDGNLRRVLARLFDVQEPLGTAAAERQLQALAQAHLPPGEAGAYNQALMDLGAMVCTPKSPHCEICPLQDLCQAWALGLQEARPVRKPRAERPHRLVTAAVIRQGERVLITQRPPDGLLGGLWEFPGGKLEPGEALVDGLRREIQEELGVEVAVEGALGVYQHAYTHFSVTLHAFGCRLLDGRPQRRQVADLRWVRLDELPDYPMGKIDRQIAERISASRDGTVLSGSQPPRT